MMMGNIAKSAHLINTNLLYKEIYFKIKKELKV